MIDFCSSAVLSDPSVAPPVMTHSEKIAAVVEVLNQFEQPDIPPTHYFLPGLYLREITMPAGCLGVGHKHKTKHMSIALTGRAIVTMDGEAREVIAPAMFECEVGSQKAFQVFEEFRFLTVHANPKDLRDILEIEREIFDLPEEIIQAAIPLNDFRMKRNTLPCQD